MVTVNVSEGQDLRIHLYDGSIVELRAMDVINMIRQTQGLPLLHPVSEKKSCPNDDCPGGWAPDRLKSGEMICPQCRTVWKDDKWTAC